jgi:hypothetical protein
MNTGIEKAREAALAVDGFLAVPELDGRKCDFNDLHREKGPEAVSLAIEAAFRPDATRQGHDPGVVPHRIVALTIDELLKRNFPPMEPLLEPWLCKQHLSMVHAWRGIGKTHFALAVAYAVAGGGTFLKWKAAKPRRVVYIDGEPLDEPYLTEEARSSNGDLEPKTVPDGELFVMGDNRGNSADSRYGLGTVPLDRVIGKAFVLIWPPSHVGGIG